MNRDFSRAPAPFDSHGHRHGTTTTGGAAAVAGAAAVSVAPNATSASGSAASMSTYIPAAAACRARIVAMEKRSDERSFGMTLEQQRAVTSLDFPRVSFVFPDLAASRAGLRNGCVIEAVDHRSVQGYSVKAVAALFRARTRVTMQVRWPPTSPSTVPAAAPTPAPTSAPPSLPLPTPIVPTVPAPPTIPAAPTVPTAPTIPTLPAAPTAPSVSAAPLPATAPTTAPAASVSQSLAAANPWAPPPSQAMAPPRPNAPSQTTTPSPAVNLATTGHSQPPAVNTPQLMMPFGTPLLPPTNLMTTAAQTMLVSTLQAVVESQKRALTMALQTVSRDVRPNDAKPTAPTTSPSVPSVPVQTVSHVTQPQSQPSGLVQSTAVAAEQTPSATSSVSSPPVSKREVSPEPQPEPVVAVPQVNQKTEAPQAPSLPAALPPRSQPVQAPVEAPVSVPVPPPAPRANASHGRMTLDTTSSATVAAPTPTTTAPVYPSPQRSTVSGASSKSPPTSATSPSTVNITALLPNMTRRPPPPTASTSTSHSTVVSDGSQTPRGSGKKRARPSTSPSHNSRNNSSTSQAVARRPPPIPDTNTQPQSNGHAASAPISVDRQSETNGPSAHKKPRGGRSSRRRESLTPSDSDDAVCLLGSEAETISSADSSSASSSPSTAGGSRKRRYSTRQSESGGRVRRSLTVDRLVTMGFKREDAEASVGACGHDVEKCMVWIVSHLEEKQFLNDLNQASIESELSKRAEESQQKKQESETLKQATAFTSLFPTSYVLSSDSEAPQLKRLLSSTIGCISAETLMRTTLTRLLKLEAQAIRWYKDASRCYMLQLARRLEAAMDAHDVLSCCTQWMASDAASRSSCCAFVQTLCSEEQALTTALFHMPENHGGVPLEFLRADESMQFSLEDDGFEVLDDVTEFD